MILLVLAIAAVSAAGPGLRLMGHGADGNPIVAVLDSEGRVATRVTCLRNQWIDSDQSAAKLIASTEVMATVVATNGRLTSLEQLGPRRFDCVLLPDDAK